MSDYAANYPAHPERSAAGAGGVTRFSEGVDVGYRWFARQNIAPSFAFGYGLSYTHFAYSGVSAVPAGDGGLDVGFTLRNTGAHDGDDVPQVYLGAPQRAPTGADFAVKALAGFTRLHLAAGASTAIKIHVPARSLQYWSVARGGWQVAHGPRAVMVGGASNDLPLSVVASVP